MIVGSLYKRVKREGPASGFTLVELLVVVFILSILAAIIFPILIRVQESARTTECLSNMRQIGISGIQIYCDDYNSRMPAAVSWGSPSYWAQYNRKTIQELLNRYIRNGLIPDNSEGFNYYSKRGIFVCPSDFGIPRAYMENYQYEINGVHYDRPIWKVTGCSYEYYASDQYNMLDEDNEPVEVPWTGLSPERAVASGVRRVVGAPYAAIRIPARKAVLGEVYFWHMGDMLPDGRIAFRNTLFADGHVKRVRGNVHLESRIQQLMRWDP